MSEWESEWERVDGMDGCAGSWKQRKKQVTVNGHIYSSLSN